MPHTDHSELPPSALREILLAARKAGFLGLGPVERHLLHAEGFVTLARAQAPLSPGLGTTRLLDLGSGGGLPGLVIAAQWSSATVVLLDANQRRTDFLARVVHDHGLAGRVQVVHDRAESCGRDPLYRGTFDGVVVRSFGPPAVVAECAAPFLRVGGWMIVSEPPGAPESDSGSRPPGNEPEHSEHGSLDGSEDAGRWPAGELERFGLKPEEFARMEFGYQLLRQEEACPERFPRRNGVPAKSPLF